MKNYNFLLWGVAAYLVFRYLKRRKSGAVGVPVLPEALQPLQPIVPYVKPGSIYSPIVPQAQAEPVFQQTMAPEPTFNKVPPSKSFKPDQL